MKSIATSANQRSNKPDILGGFGVVAALILSCVIVGVLAYQIGIQHAAGNSGSSLTGAELRAQQSSALATWTGAAVSAFTLIVTAIGVWFIKNTLDATWKAVEDTTSATQAMIDANKIARSSSRPLMMFDIEEAFFEGPPFESPWDGPQHNLNHHIRPTFSFKNFGTQPCWIISAWMSFYIAKFVDGQLHVPDDLQDWFRVANAGFVQPGVSLKLGGGFYGISPGDADLIENGGGVVFGMCQYRSLGGDIFCTRYAYQVPIQRPHNKSTDRGFPIANLAHWRDGLVRSGKLTHEDRIEWVET